MAREDENHDGNANIPPPVPPTQQAPHTLSTIKLPILKNGEYNIWAMKMEHYLGHTDYPIWEVIQKGNGPVQVSTDTNRQIRASLLKMPIRSSLGLYLLPGLDILVMEDKPGVHKNVAFVSSSTSSTNDVSTAYGVSTSSGHNSQREGSSSYTDELMYSFFANQSSGPQLDHEDLEQVDEFDLEEMDLKWQVALISHEIDYVYKRVQDKKNKKAEGSAAGTLDYKSNSNGRRPRKQEEPKALVTLDGDGVDWTGHAEDEQENFA
ncbi:hypothetical protein Tco_1012293 [Tanacetum coccineum]